jgi:hypothetical protein
MKGTGIIYHNTYRLTGQGTCRKVSESISSRILLLLLQCSTLFVWFFWFSWDSNNYSVVLGADPARAGLVFFANQNDCRRRHITRGEIN